MLASIIKVNGFSPFRTLMLREYWENRRAIFTTPLVITALSMFLIVVAMGIFGQKIEIDHQKLSLSEIIADMSTHDAEQLTQHINHLLLMGTVPMMIGAWFCMIFTALGSLYDERKDNSILFWKSMPISDLQTVLSKLLTVLFVIPFMALGFATIFQLFLLIVGTVSTIGTGYNPWDLIWSAINVPGLILTEFVALIIYSLWALPIFAWFMLASVIAKRTPFLVATIPVALAALFEELFFDTNHLLEFVAKRLSVTINEGAEFSGGSFEKINIQTALDILQSAMHPEFWMGLAIAAGLLYGTILLRKRNSL